METLDEKSVCNLRQGCRQMVSMFGETVGGEKCNEGSLGSYGSFVVFSILAMKMALITARGAPREELYD